MVTEVYRLFQSDLNAIQAVANTVFSIDLDPVL